MINDKEIPELYRRLKYSIARDFGGRSSGSTSTGTGTGGGGGGGGDFADLTGTIADGQAPQFLLRSGARSLQGNMAVDLGVTIDGVDLDVHAANPDAHHDRASGGAGITVTGQAVSVNQGYGFVWTAQHTFTAGLLATHIGATGSLLIDPTNDLTLDPGGIIYVPVTQQMRTPTFSSSYPIAGFNLTETNISGQSGLTIGSIVADELRVRVFVADETRVDRGEKYDSKSYGILAADFVTPSLVGSSVRIYFEDSPAISGAIFSNNDWLVFRVLDVSSGLLVASIWGQVTSYIDEANDQQSWLFTLRQGLGGYTVKKGRLAVDWGASGQGLIHYSAVDPNGAPYIEMIYWAGSDPYTPANYTKVVRFGNLKSSYDYGANAYGFAAGNFAGSWLAADASNGFRVMAGTTTRLRIDTAGNFNIYNSSGSAVITLDNAGASYFAGPMTLGASGGIYQGSGTFGSPTTGLKIWNNSGYGSIGGYNTGALQWIADTDGRIKAGQNSVQLGYYGLDLVAYSGADPNPTDNVRALAFWDSLSSINGTNKPAARIWGGAGAGSGQYGLQLEAIHPTFAGSYPKMWLSWDLTGRYFVVTDVDHLWLTGNNDVIISGPLAIGNTATVHNIVPAASLTHDLGSPGAYFSKIYVDQIIANTVTGGTALGGQVWQYDSGDMFIRSNSGSARTLYIANPGAGTMNLDVEGSITAGGLINGINLGTLSSNLSTLSTNFSTHTANPNAHHNQAHVLATTGGLGPDHTTSGLTTGQVLMATGATTAAFAQLPHSYLFGIGPNDHHSQSHILASTGGLGGDHTVSGLTAGQVLVATGATTAVFGQLQHSQLGSLTSDDHTQYFNQARGDARYFQLTGGTITGATTITTSAFVANLTLSNAGGAAWALTFTRSDLGTSTGLRNAGGFVEFQATPQVVGSGLIWHSNNDGSGSGLDADTVDLFHATDLVAVAVARTITAQHSFAPGATQAPFLIGTNAQNQTVIGLKADQLNKSVSTDSTLTGGGALTANLTLGVNLSNAFTWAANHTWSSGSINLTSGDIQASGTAWLMNTRRVRAAAGSNSTPAYTFSSDTNTGIYSGGTGIVSFTAAGSDTIQVNSQRINPASSVAYDIGDYNRKYKTLYVGELYAQTLVAQSVLATVGGRIAVAPTTSLIADLALAKATVDTKHNIFQVGDFIYMESAPGGIPQFEAMKVVSTATTITGGYRYTVLRAVNNGAVNSLIATLGTGTTIDVSTNNLVIGDTIYITDATDTNSEFMTVTAGPTTIVGGYRYTVTRGAGGSTVITSSPIGTYIGRVTRLWVKGDAVIDIGGSIGQGYIDLTSTSTILSHLGPTMAIYSRTNFANWNALAPTVALGNLRSFLDYTGDTFGFAVGNDLTLTPSGGFKGIAGDAANGLRLISVDYHQYTGSTEFLRINTQGISVLANSTPTTQNSLVWYNSALGPSITDISSIGYVSGYRQSNINTMSLAAMHHAAAAALHLASINEDGSTTGIDVYGNSTTYTQTGRIEYAAKGHYIYETASNFGVYVQSARVIIGTGGNLPPNNGITFTNAWSSNADANNSEISNDRGSFKQLMIVGNSSANGSTRRVGLWDQVQIGGSTYYQVFNVAGGGYFSSSVGIGVTSPSYTLDVAGAAHASSFPTSSDRRLKNILAPVTGVLDRLENINAYMFTWKPGYHAYNEFLDGAGRPRTQIGFLAQEVLAQYPELITEWQHTGDIPLQDALAVDYARMVSLLLVAVKELRQEVRELRKGQ